MRVADGAGPEVAHGAGASSAAAAAELAACASLEITAGREEEARTIGAILPAGTRVYVNHLPRNRLADSLPTMRTLHECGLEPVPHVAARRVTARAELVQFLSIAIAEAGVRRVLLIGGDVDAPAGPYKDSESLLRDGALAGTGLAEVGVAGYPEGHPRIAQAAIDAALAAKLSILAAQGLAAYMVTQFTFAPARMVAYCDRLSREHPDLPVYAGFAGPTEAATLLRFAKRCGVSASLRALKNLGMNAVRVITHTDPGDQLASLARYHAAHPSSNVAGIHLFCFGGARASAAWIKGVIAGTA